MIEKNTPSRVMYCIINYTLIGAFALICLLPIWHVLMASFSNPRLLMANPTLLLTPLGDITTKGYALVFKNANILSGYGNTLFYVAGTTILCSVGTLIAGYLCSRKHFKLAGPLTVMILFTMMFGGGMIPTYMVIRSLGMINTPWAILIPGVLNAFYIIVMKNSFEQLSPSYEESARLDGAGAMTILWRILVPMVKATVAVIVMFTVVQQWNSWFPASIYLPARRDLWPLQLFMREILVQNDTSTVLTGEAAVARADMTSNLVKYCVTIIGTLPVLCAYPFAQKYFIMGVTLGGVKG